MTEWIGKFGRDYTLRNTFDLRRLEKKYKKMYGITRSRINELLLHGLNKKMRILEVGANSGNQLLLLQKLGFRNLYGIEINDFAINLGRKRTRHINFIKGSIFDIPFKDNFFDLVLTSGVLIHIKPEDIAKGLNEVYRVAKSYIFGLEYFAAAYRGVVYRGRKNMLWKTDFPRLYAGFFKDLKLKKLMYLKYLDSKNMDVAFLFKKS